MVYSWEQTSKMHLARDEVVSLIKAKVEFEGAWKRNIHVNGNQNESKTQNEHCMIFIHIKFFIPFPPV